ncbi:helix-turn-helix domain-containing protein [Paenibacillus faecalis]|uniref:helix-turn-helix domain-containing protein n=1 Tax=Paenibacillus faecalis TaxID=2079532 RepID=UPI000D0EA6FB|nr:helix-turn-helix domain-containing protein [Paenibacillus faecalis]
MKIRDDNGRNWFKLLMNKPSFYRKMILLSLLSSIIPILILGVSSYAMMNKMVKDDASYDVSRILSYASQTIDTGMDRVQNNLIQLQLGSFFSSDLVELKRNNYAGFYTNVYQNLSAFKNGNPQIKDISLYSIDENYVISATYGGQKLESDEEIEKAQQLLNDTKQLYWKTGYSLNGTDYNDGISIISTLPLHTNDPIGFLQIIIDNQMFTSLAKPFVKYENERMYVLDDTGKLVFHINDPSVPDELFEMITVTNQGEKDFFYNWEGKEYLVTSKLSPIYNLLYIDMIPTEELYSSSKWIVNMTILMIGIVLVTGIVLAMFGAQRVYRPIKKLIHHVSGNQAADMGMDEFSYVNKRWAEINSKAMELEGQLNEQFPLIREIFALRLMEGQFIHDRKEHLLALLRRYNIPEQQSAAVFIIAVDQFVEEAKFQEEDKDLIIFVMKNIAAELLEQQGLDGIVINVLNDQVVVWLWNEHKEMEDWERSLKAAAEVVRQQIAHYLNSPVTIGLSRTANQVEQIPDLYREAQLAFHSRMINGGNQIIESKGVTNSLNYRYPAEIEAHFTASLQVGDFIETERMLRAFADQVQKAVHNPELILMSYDQLLSTTLRTAFLMDIHYDSLFGRTPYDLSAEMRECKTIQELNDWFTGEILEPIMMSVSNQKNQEYENLIHKVTQYIEEHYQQDISLDQCAQICDISPQYLSKLFKKVMDISFIEYLTQVRIAKARELLVTTDLLVNEIAEKIGYHPKNFIRVFKKHIGVPPGQYREMHRKK